MTTELSAPPTGPNAKVSTLDTGAPAPSDQFTLGANSDGSGPILLHDFHFLNQMAHFNRERVPERNVHAKGGGAFGVFQTTETSASTPRLRCSSRALRPTCWPASPPSPASWDRPTPSATRAASR